MEAVYEYILAVKRTGSFTKAAESLHVSQPALSIAIKKIENELNITIFNRKSNPIMLTDEGRIIIEHINNINEIEINTKTKLSDMKKTSTGCIKMGGTQYFTAFIFPELVKRCARVLPGLTIELVEASSYNLLSKLDEDEIDLMFSAKEFNESKYQFHAGLQDFLFISVPKHLLLKEELRKYVITREEILHKRYDEIEAIPSLKPLSNIPFVILKEGNNLNERARMLFQLEGISPKIEMRLDQLTTAHYISKSGLGATFTTDRLIKQIDDNGELLYIKFDHALMIRNFNIILKKNRLISSLLYDLLENISETFDV